MDYSNACPEHCHPAIPREGQRETLVADARGTVRIITLLPVSQRTIAAQHSRRWAIEPMWSLPLIISHPLPLRQPRGKVLSAGLSKQRAGQMFEVLQVNDALPA